MLFLRNNLPVYYQDFVQLKVGIELPQERMLFEKTNTYLVATETVCLKFRFSQ